MVYKDYEIVSVRVECSVQFSASLRYIFVTLTSTEFIIFMYYVLTVHASSMYMYVVGSNPTWAALFSFSVKKELFKLYVVVLPCLCRSKSFHVYNVCCTSEMEEVLFL